MLNRFFCFMLAVMLLSCKKAPTKDDIDPDPQTTLYTSEILFNSPEITISWTGNEFSFAYQYTLEYLTSVPGDYETYFISEWMTATSVLLSYLDDGEYCFTVRSRYDAGHEEASSDSLKFNIDAVMGPGLRFYPLHQAISSGSNVSMYLYVEDVQDLMGMELDISFDPTAMTILGVDPADLLLSSTTFYDELEYGDGVIRIIASGENFLGINGTGAVAQLTFRTEISGQTTISILETSLFRNSVNDDIPIVARENGLIEVISD